MIDTHNHLQDARFKSRQAEVIADMKKTRDHRLRRQRNL